MTIKVKSKENSKPPIITTPKGDRLVEALPIANATGNIPKIEVKVVIKIGLKR